MASLRAACAASTSGRFVSYHSRVACARGGRFVARVATPAVTSPISAEYAVINTPAGQQFVEEGKWFALCSAQIEQLSTDDGVLKFSPVSVKRADGEFVKGRPYLADWVVEAELLDEQAFAVAGKGLSGVGGATSVLGKVLVTRITPTDEQRRILEEAFRV